jgi:hypothetical protein
MKVNSQQYTQYMVYVMEKVYGILVDFKEETQHHLR